MSASPLAALGAVDGTGSGAEVGALCLALGALGHEVVVHTRRVEPDLPPQVRLGPGVTVQHVDAGPQGPMAPRDLIPFLPRIAGELAGRWLARPPDVVHAHHWDSGVPAVDATAAATVPVAVTFHALGSPSTEARASTRLDLERRLASSADQVIATTGAQMRELLMMGTSPDHLVVVPQGVDTTVFSPRGPGASPGSGLHRLLALGDLASEGGVDDAIRMVAQVPDAELVIAGGPPAAAVDRDRDVARLQGLVQQLEISDRVTFLGAVGRADQPALLRSADVVVCLPWHQLSTRVALEAMACGRPVVAAASGGLLDAVEDGITGLLVEPRAPSAAALAVRRLLSAPGLRHTMSENARSRAEVTFDWRQVARAAEAVYRSMRRDSGSPQAHVRVPARQRDGAPTRRGSQSAAPFGRG